MSRDAPIFWVTGPPASGKTTLCGEILQRYSPGIQIPVDDLRDWVVSGRADPVPWTDETEWQFRVAEQAACGILRCYHDAGFVVALDHCRNLPRLAELFAAYVPDLPIVKVFLIPDLDANLARAHSRTNKPFDPHYLDEIIVYTNGNYRLADTTGWLVVDNSKLSVEETADLVVASIR